MYHILSKRFLSASKTSLHDHIFAPLLKSERNASHYMPNKLSPSLTIRYIFQRQLSIIDFTLNYPPIRNNLTSASLLSMLIQTDDLNYPPIRNNLTSTSLLSMLIETDYNTQWLHC